MAAVIGALLLGTSPDTSAADGWSAALLKTNGVVIDRQQLRPRHGSARQSYGARGNHGYQGNRYQRPDRYSRYHPRQPQSQHHSPRYSVQPRQAWSSRDRSQHERRNNAYERHYRDRDYRRGAGQQTYRPERHVEQQRQPWSSRRPQHNHRDGYARGNNRYNNDQHANDRNRQGYGSRRPERQYGYHLPQQKRWQRQPQVDPRRYSAEPYDIPTYQYPQLNRAPSLPPPIRRNR